MRWLAWTAVFPLLVGGSFERSSDPTPEQVDAVFAQYNRTDGPGCALGVFRNGQMAYAKGYGMADLNQRTPIRPNTVFYIASTSKQFTAFAVALASQQGKLRLDDPIRKFVPELPAYADRITVRQLVHHLSGIRDYLGLWSTSGRSFADEIPERAALDLIARQKATDFAPGAQWAYSNSGYFLLSVIVHRATGLTLREFTERYQFRPLEMRRTHFHDDNQEIVPDRAEGYEPKRGGGFKIVRTSFAAVGDGGLYTTVEDLLKWDGNFYNNTLGGGQALLDEVLTPARLPNGDDTRYGFGLFKGTHRGLATVEHGGAFIGYRAQLLRFPSERFSVAVLCNEGTAAPEQLALQVANLYLSDRLAPEVASGGGTGTPTADVVVPASTLDRYLGRYEIMPGAVAAIRKAGSGISVDAFGRQFPLVARSDSVFVGVGLPGELEFKTGPKGVGLFIKGLTAGGPVPPLAQVPDLTAAAKAALAGRYTSVELDSWATVAVTEGALRVQSRQGPWVPMDPIAPDVFLANGARLAVVRAPGGRVTGFRLSAARLANIEYVRAVEPTRR